MRNWSQFLFSFGKRRLPLVDALHFLHSSAEIIRRHVSNNNHLPDEADFILLKQIINKAQDVRLEAMYTHHCFERQAHITDCGNHNKAESDEL